ncbi:MAG: CHAT domain-containing protein [Gammaproteobacteria bacterium]|nr:CHAT domain-containing protein [Gammaproteobacteria bacterium]
MPAVARELVQISSLFDNNTILLDKNFLLDNFSRALQYTAYSIVHIASHAHVERDPTQTFLLTYDDKLTMSRLENILHKNPVDLLVLSAVQTAKGYRRVPLGMAGMAIQSGVKSVLASLWSVHDEATSQLMIEFYRQLQNPDLSKAQALQNAQLLMIKRFDHPFYWAPFILIGNWL